MSHLYRFYVSPETVAEDPVILPSDELHHALHVLRVEDGQQVALFDGAGRDMSGVVRREGKRALHIEVTSVRDTPAPEYRLVLCQALLTREKSHEPLIRRCTELGVSRFVFFRGDHSSRKAASTSKWERFAIDSCKQCGRLWLPEFHVVDSLDACIELCEGPVLIAAVEGDPSPLRAVLSDTRACSAIIGPEGDFSEREREVAIGAGAHPISFGEHVLRSEVAATVAATLIRYEWGQLGPLP